MNLFKRFATSLIAMMMGLFMTLAPILADETVATNNIDTSKTGSITVTKYKGTSASTGKEDLTGTTSDNPYKDENLVDGVKFTLYKVEDADFVKDYYNGTNKDEKTISNYVSKNGTGKEIGSTGYKWTSSSVTFDKIGEQTTGSDGTGKTTFSGLEVGFYVLLETGYEDDVKIDSACEPTLISLPMANKDSSTLKATSWNYDISVYPKNETEDAQIELYKFKDIIDGDAFENVSFKLEKKNGDTWTDITSTIIKSDDSTKTKLSVISDQINDEKSALVTGSDGAIKVKGLSNGTYRFTEISTTDKTYIIDTASTYEFNVEGLIVNFTGTNLASAQQYNVGTDLTAYTYATGEANNSSTDPAIIKVANFKPAVNKSVKAKDGTYKTTADYAIGETVTYHVTVKVPENITKLESFTLTDTPTNIKYSELTSIKCGETALTSPTNYTVDTIGDGYKITFVPSSMGAYAGQEIVVEYKAVVQNTALTTTTGNPNEVTLEYDNDVKTNTESTNTQKDKANVYTFEIDLTKQLQGNTDTKLLAGIEFELYDSTGSKISFVKTTSGDTTYYNKPVTDDDTSKASPTLATDEKGNIVIKGLANGTYTLKETKTAKDYNLLSSDITIVIGADIKAEADADTTGDKKVANYTEITGNFENTTGANAFTDATVDVTVVNKKGFNLPLTGGFGLISFTAGGLLLVLGGILLFKNSRKQKA